MISSHLRRVFVALGQAADRRGLTSDPRWVAVHDALSIDHGLPVAGRTDQVLADDEAATDALHRVGAVFGLQAAERDLLLVTAAADLDPNIALAYGLLGDPTGGPIPPSVALAMELTGLPFLTGRGRLLLGATAPLRRWGLVRLGPGSLLLGRALTAGGPIGTLLDDPVQEPICEAMTVSVSSVGDLAEVSGELAAGPVDTLAAALTAGVPLAWVEAPAGAAGAETAVAAFDHANLAFTMFDLALRPPAEPLVETVASLVRRCGLLASGMVLLSAEMFGAEPDVTRAMTALQHAPVPVVLVARSHWNAAWHPELPVVVRAQRLSTAQRLEVWRRYVSEEQVPAAALTPYRLSPRQIEAAGKHFILAASLSDRQPDQVMIAQTVRMLGGSRQFHSGTGGIPATFDDLQVPADTRAALQRLSDWVRLRDEVNSNSRVDAIGQGRSGIAALFTGNPGTGKTLAAHIIADTVGLDLLQVDLSGVIDKYIGKTEKNLERIFTDAENLNVVLFFDEADAFVPAAAARCGTPATGTPTRRCPTCSSGWSNSTGSPCWQPICAGTWTPPSPGDCNSSCSSPTPTPDPPPDVAPDAEPCRSRRPGGSPRSRHACCDSRTHRRCDPQHRGGGRLRRRHRAVRHRAAPPGGRRATRIGEAGRRPPAGLVSTQRPQLIVGLVVRIFLRVLGVGVVIRCCATRPIGGRVVVSGV